MYQSYNSFGDIGSKYGQVCGAYVTGKETIGTK